VKQCVLRKETNEKECLEETPDLLRHSVQFQALNNFEIAKRGQLYSCEAWNNMNMQVEDVLSRCFAVLLNDADSVGVSRFLYRSRYCFSGDMHCGKLFLWNVENIYIVSFWDDKRVTRP